MENKFNFKAWEEMHNGILQREKINKTKWGFECLRAATELRWDIGQEVYFANGNTVLKGIITSVNFASMCMVKIIPNNDTSICLATNELYTNVRYALKKAEYNSKLQQATQ